MARQLEDEVSREVRRWADGSKSYSPLPPSPLTPENLCGVAMAVRGFSREITKSARLQAY